jgi:uncharacterized protein YgbK (DUF1537 family)
MLVIADDLTGAADSAAAFTSSGHRCVVSLDGLFTRGDTPDTIVSIDTDSRDMLASDAFAVTAAAISRHSPTELFIKIDSTLRGNVRATVEAALSTLSALKREPDRILICPAFPQLGRTVVNGRVHVHGVPLDGTDLCELFDGLRTEGRVEIPDVQTDHDLAIAVGSALGSALGNTLWVGSAGLARHVGASIAANDAARRDGETIAAARRPCSRVVVIAGSQHPSTLKQIDALNPSTNIAALHPLDPQFSARADQAARGADGLVLTGGATARIVLDLLEVRSLDVRGEVEPGIAWSTGRGRSGDITVVTKAGGFGDTLALQRAADFLSRS